MPTQVRGFSDSDYAGSYDRKSTSGYLTFMDTDLVGWRSGVQPVVALSTTEAELISAVRSGKELKFAQNVLLELGLPVHRQIELDIDNQSTIKITRNPENFTRAKHISTQFHWLRLEEQRRIFKLRYTRSEDNVADLLTKPLGWKVFTRLRDRIMC